MRIVSGKWGGRIISAPDGQHTRPTSERVREALFSILQHRIPDAVVLDLFAGSGALAFEALSRGAHSAVLVDSAAASIACIRENIKHLDATDARLLACDAFAALRQLQREQTQTCAILNEETPPGNSADRGMFDVVFLDPPYASGIYGEAMYAVIPLLKKAALVIAESDMRCDFPVPPAFSTETDRSYGDARVRVFVWEGLP